MKRPQRQSQIPLYAVVLFVCLMSPQAAEAHLNSTGMGPIYDGLMHFLMSPEDLVSVLALALLSGLRGATYGRRTLFGLPAAWLFGGLFGLAASVSNGNAIVSAVWFLLLGGLLAADAKLSLRVTTALAVLLGLYHGYLNGAGLGLNFTSAAVLLGLTFSVFVLVALSASFVVQLQASWARIAVRVAGSWIFATGLLLMGWAVRSAQAPQQSERSHTESRWFLSPAHTQAVYYEDLVFCAYRVHFADGFPAIGAKKYQGKFISSRWPR